KPSHLLIQLYIISHLTLFSLLGTLARLGIQWLTTYPGAPITTSVLWANVGGSFVMGFLSEDRRLFQFPTHLSKPTMTSSDRKALHSKHKKTIPLYIGLATGFCGSFTSFSSFIRDAFLALSNDLPASLYHPVAPAVPPPRFSSTHPRNAGYSLPALLAVLISEPALSLSALFVGAHTALLLDKYTPSLPASVSRVLDPLAIPLGLGAWLAAILIAIFPTNSDWRGEVLFALVFAPLGTLVRYFVSLQLNSRVKSFPVGTFAVNICGSAVLGMAWDLQRVRIGGVPGGGALGCQVLQGIEDGFCGCLTTVSTWVAELQGLRRGHAYRYALVSLGVGLATMVVVMGSVRWSVGWEAPVCV
ncbi:CrcB-like protein-domain-containing protein, partial [Elsinoe ampelina]